MCIYGGEVLKRTYADRPNWRRVTEKRFDLKYINDEVNSGYLSIIYIDKVREPLVINVAGKDLYLADDGFVWTQYFPDEGNYALTTMFNEKHEIVQLYFDICTGNKLSPTGMPYYDDLYLDVVLVPSGEILLLDEDELKQALLDKDITEEEFKLGYSEAETLMGVIAKDKDKVLHSCKKHLEYMLSE